VATRLGRENEARLREPELVGERLHRLVVEVARVGEDRELVTRKCAVREDVDDDEAQRPHERTVVAISETMLGAMLLFLVRHAHADPGEPDELRRLSARGRGEARAVGERLAAHDTPPELVLTSPLVRARETAEAIADATGAGLAADERLAPGASAELVQQAIAGVEGPVAVVGHQPDCSEIALAMTGRDPGFPTGGVQEITLES
jgi:phosphohistidine phosphatase